MDMDSTIGTCSYSDSAPTVQPGDACSSTRLRSGGLILVRKLDGSLEVLTDAHDLVPFKEAQNQRQKSPTAQLSSARSYSVASSLAAPTSPPSNVSQVMDISAKNLNPVSAVCSEISSRNIVPPPPKLLDCRRYSLGGNVNIISNRNDVATSAVSSFSASLPLNVSALETSNHLIVDSETDQMINTSVASSTNNAFGCALTSSTSEIIGNCNGSSEDSDSTLHTEGGHLASSYDPLNLQQQFVHIGSAPVPSTFNDMYHHPAHPQPTATAPLPVNAGSMISFMNGVPMNGSTIFLPVIPVMNENGNLEMRLDLNNVFAPGTDGSANIARVPPTGTYQHSFGDTDDGVTTAYLHNVPADPSTVAPAVASLSSSSAAPPCLASTTQLRLQPSQNTDGSVVLVLSAPPETQSLQMTDITNPSFSVIHSSAMFNESSSSMSMVTNPGLHPPPPAVGPSTVIIMSSDEGSSTSIVDHSACTGSTPLLLPPSVECCANLPSNTDSDDKAHVREAVFEYEVETDSATDSDSVRVVGNGEEDKVNIIPRKEEFEDEFVQKHQSLFVGKKRKKRGGVAKANKVYICECGYKVDKDSVMRRHMKSHSNDRPFKCPVCEKCFKTLQAKQNHINVHTGVKEHECKDCLQSFTTTGELLRHRRYKHTKERPHVCDQCDYSAVEYSKLVRHMRTHTGERPYKCKECGYAFSDNGLLKRHMRVHTNEKPFECEECLARFSQSNSLKAHLITHQETQPEFKCPYCDTTCRRRPDLKIHIRNLHTSRRPIPCSKCDCMFQDRYSYKKHLKTHEGQRCFKCNQCDFATTSQRQLNQHQTTHSAEKPYLCDVPDCKARFRLPELLKRHTNLKHNPEYVPPAQKEKLLQCDTCSKKFHFAANLKKHVEKHAAGILNKNGRKKNDESESEADSENETDSASCDEYAEDSALLVKPPAEEQGEKKKLKSSVKLPNDAANESVVAAEAQICNVTSLNGASRLKESPDSKTTGTPEDDIRPVGSASRVPRNTSGQKRTPGSKRRRSRSKIASPEKSPKVKSSLREQYTKVTKRGRIGFKTQTLNDEHAPTCQRSQDLGKDLKTPDSESSSLMHSVDGTPVPSTMDPFEGSRLMVAEDGGMGDNPDPILPQVASCGSEADDLMIVKEVELERCFGFDEVVGTSCDGPLPRSLSVRKPNDIGHFIKSKLIPLIPHAEDDISISDGDRHDPPALLNSCDPSCTDLSVTSDSCSQPATSCPDNRIRDHALLSHLIDDDPDDLAFPKLPGPLLPAHPIRYSFSNMSNSNSPGSDANKFAKRLANSEPSQKTGEADAKSPTKSKVRGNMYAALMTRNGIRRGLNRSKTVKKSGASISSSNASVSDWNMFDIDTETRAAFDIGESEL